MKEPIEIVVDEFAMELDQEQRRVVEVIIKHSRHLNQWGAKNVSHPLPGTEFLHGLLQEKIISNALYEQLRRVAEDLKAEYEIKIISE